MIIANGKTQLETMITNLEEQVATIDPITGAVMSVPSDHNYIYKGGGFKFYIELEEVGATPILYSFKTPANLFVHLKNLRLESRRGSLRFTISRPTLIDPLEIDNPGSAALEVVGPSNLSAVWDAEKPSGSTILKSPTFVSGQEGSTWVMLKNIGAGSNNVKTFDRSAMTNNEVLVTNKDTYYILKFERIEAVNPELVTLEMFWYEEPYGKK